ncbi:MAG: diguanylate cyclase [Firmicutes bacterium]|nr:diguanylate cyclase [Bacillota bacterium]
MEHPDLALPASPEVIRVVTSHLFSLLPYPMLLLNRDGEILAANPAAERLWAASAEELEGRGAVDVLGLYQVAGDKLSPWRSWAELQETLKQGERISTLLSARNGQTLWAQVVGTSFEHRSNRYSLIIVVQHRPSNLLQEPPSWAWRDPVTGLGNRAYWEHLGLESHPQGVVILFDVDGLKSVNDRHGHQEGDRLLQLVGQTAAARLPSQAVAVRYGGDEFLVWNPEADAEWAEQWAQALDEAIRLEATRRKAPWTPKLSFGLAPYPPGTLAQALARADDALYEQKGILLRSARGGRLVIQRSQPVILIGGDGSHLPAENPQPFSSLFSAQFAPAMRRQYARWVDEAQAFVSWMRPTSGIAAVEVGAGNGRITFDGGLAERIGPEGVLVLTDPSIAQLHHARERAQGRYHWVHLLPAAAEHLPFASHGADLVTGAWFLHLCDPRAALREMARVTRPGGEVVLDVLLAFPWPPAWLEMFRPLLNALAEEGLTLRHMFAQPGEIPALGEQLGLVVEDLTRRDAGEMEFLDAPHAWTFLEQGGHIALMMRGLPETRKGPVREALKAHFEAIFNTLSPAERRLRTRAEYVRFRLR